MILLHSHCNIHSLNSNVLANQRIINIAPDAFSQMYKLIKHFRNSNSLFLPESPAYNLYADRHILNQLDIIYPTY
jgi:hypothetical protein